MNRHNGPINETVVSPVVRNRKSLHGVLLVDPEEDFRNGVESALTNDGFLVESASTGQQALQKIGESFYDIAIIELSLEDIEGFDLLARVKEIDPSIMMMILTRSNSLDWVIKAMRSGAVDYLLKDKPEEIIPRVNECLEKLEARRKVKLHEDLLSVCCMCRKIRDDEGGEPGEGIWMDYETYLVKKSRVILSHGYCPQCLDFAQKTAHEMSKRGQNIIK